MPPKRARLNMRVEYKWKKNLDSASLLSGKSSASIVEQAVNIYLDKHFKEVVREGNE